MTEQSDALVPLGTDQQLPVARGQVWDVVT